MTMKKYAIAGMACIALGALSACSATTPPPAPEQATNVDFEKGTAGGTITHGIKVQAKVTGIDKENRTLTLMDHTGETFEIVAGPEVVNFEQIEKGDSVVVTMAQQLVISVFDKDEQLPEGSAGAVALAPEGAKPGAAAAGTTLVKATVVSIDEAHHEATLRFCREETVPVRPDVNLSKYKAGDQVLFMMTKALAIEVVKPESDK